jgi:hypothetical protein
MRILVGQGLYLGCCILGCPREDLGIEEDLGIDVD